MSRRVAFLFAVVIACLPSTVAAQEPLAVNTDFNPTMTAFAQAAPLDVRQLDVRPSVGLRSGQSKLLSSLMVSSVVLQALDVHSTYRALGQGAVEANPVMAGVTGNTAAFIATKAAVATATVMAARHLGKRNKIAAIATLVAINSVYAFVVDHNYRVARGLR
jgi:hypothetical protein